MTINRVNPSGTELALYQGLGALSLVCGSGRSMSWIKSGLNMETATRLNG